MLPRILDLLRRSDGPEQALAELASIAPSLARELRPLDDAAAPERRDIDEKGWLWKEGYAFLGPLAARTEAASLAAGVKALVDARLPPLFALAYRPVWKLAERACDRFSALVGEPYELLADGWAWSIRPGQAGWPPHRGGGTLRFDRRRPELVTVWIAGSDVSADRACMHVVPFDEDPNYPDDLSRTDAPLPSVRALPIGAGEALAWNANLLHWGGSCSLRAAGGRVSCSFSLGRQGSTLHKVATLPQARLDDPVARFSLLAELVALYGPQAGADVTPALLAWAAANQALTTAARP